MLWGIQLGLIQPGCPHRSPAGRQGKYGLPEPVKRAVQDRVPHGQAPHGAGLASSGIMVGQRRYGAGGTVQPAWVVQEGERDRGGPHE